MRDGVSLAPDLQGPRQLLVELVGCRQRGVASARGARDGVETTAVRQRHGLGPRVRPQLARSPDPESDAGVEGGEHEGGSEEEEEEEGEVEDGVHRLLQPVPHPALPPHHPHHHHHRAVNVNPFAAAPHRHPLPLPEDEERGTGEEDGDDKGADDGHPALPEVDVATQRLADAAVAFCCYGDEDEDGGGEEEEAEEALSDAQPWLPCLLSEAERRRFKGTRTRTRKFICFLGLSLFHKVHEHAAYLRCAIHF